MITIEPYQQETSKKIPHLGDVVCHAVQTETLRGSLLAFHASKCKYGFVEPYRYNNPFKVNVEQMLHDRKPPGYEHQIPCFHSIIA